MLIDKRKAPMLKALDYTIQAAVMALCLVPLVAVSLALLVAIGLAAMH